MLVEKLILLITILSSNNFNVAFSKYEYTIHNYHSFKLYIIHLSDLIYDVQ